MIKKKIQKRINILKDIKRPYYQYAIVDNFNNTQGCEYFGVLDYIDKEIEFSTHLLRVLEETNEM